MFDVLNTLVFNSKLPKHDIMCLNNNQIQAIFNKYHNPQHAKDLYAAYFPLPNWKAISINTPN